MNQSLIAPSSTRRRFSRFRFQFSGFSFLFLAAGLFFCTQQMAPGQISWKVASGDWDTNSNWTNHGPVTGSADYIDNGGTATITTRVNHYPGTVTVGNAASGTLLVTWGSLTVYSSVTLGRAAGSQGTVTMSGGTLQPKSSLSPITITIGQSGTGTFNLTDSGLLTVGSAGTGTVTIANQTGSVGTLNLGTGGNAGTLEAGTVTGGNGTATVNFNQSGNYTFAPTLSGTLAVNSIGTGTTTLTGTNTYTGETKVSAGTLYVNGDNSAAIGDVTVSGGTLSGIGKIGGDITVQSGGTISPGTSTNISGSPYLLVNNLALLSGSTALFNIAGDNVFGQIGSSSGLSVTGNVTFSLQLTGGYTGTVGQSFKIIDFNIFSFDVSNFSVTSNLDTKFKWDLSGLNTNGEVKIALAALAATHWLGQTGVNWSEANWASNAAGNAITATPTSADDITFSATGAANQTNTVLDVDTTIKSLTVESSAGIKGNRTLTINEVTDVSAGTLTLAGGVKLVGNRGLAIEDGTLTVTGNGTRATFAGVIDVGYSNAGTGTLNVTAGGQVSTDRFIPVGAKGVGIVNVDGAGSKLTSAYELVLGYSQTTDSGTLNITNGGVVKVSSYGAYIGSAGIGSATVDGADSALNVDGEVVLASKSGANGTLNIQNGGLVSVGGGTGTLNLGAQSGSTGTLNIGSAITPGSAGTLQATEVHGGSGTAILNFNHNQASYKFDPKITGSTAVNQNGPGRTVIAMENTYTGRTTISAGVLQTENASALGTGPVTIKGGILGVAGPLTGISALRWNAGNIALSPGQGDMITTAGAFTNGDGGGKFLIGTKGLMKQTYTLVNFDSTNFLPGDFSALSSSPSLNYQYSFALNQNKVQVTILGATVTGNQLHNIENGVPTFGDFTATGNVVSGLTPDGNREPNTIVNSLGTTPGSSLDIPDWNTLNITGNQPTVIVGGSSLNLDGTLNAKQIIIDALAQMTGHGFLNGDLLNEGTVAPGNSPGTLTIAGNFTQTNTGTLQIQIASPAVFDQLIVGGTASLAGTLQVQSYGGYQLQYGQQFAFLHAGSITGAFDSITTSDPSIFRARFLVNGGTGTILIAPASYTLVAQTQNQKNVAKALDGFIAATTGDRQAVSLALDLQSSSQYPAAFNAIAPTFYESLANITIEQTATRAQMLAQRSSSVRLGARGFQAIGIEAPLKYDKDGRNVMDAKDGKNIMSPADDNRWGVWVQGNGIFARATSVNQTPSYNFENGGFLAGADYQWSEDFVTGVYAGYQGTYAKYSNGGVTTINAVDFGLYAGYHSGGFYADAIVGGGSSAYAVRRPIQFSTVNRPAASKPDGGQFTTYLGFGYDWQVGNFTIGPILSGQYTYAGIAPFTETGAGALDLAVSQQNVNSLRASLGGRVAYTWKLSDKVSLIPEGRLFWQHEFLENSRSIASSLDGGNGPSFDYATSAPSRDAVFAAAGVSAQFGPNWTAYLYYNADFGRQDYIGHSVSTGLNFKF